MKPLSRSSDNSEPTLNILLVGTGRMAEMHAIRFAELDQVRVLAGVDTDLAKARDFCRKHEIDYAYQDLEQALCTHAFDAVSVVTPDAYHASVVIPVLNRELPVLCEKPLADTLKSAASMCAAARESGQLNLVNLSYRVSGALNRARSLVDAGALGSIRHVEASYRQSWLCSDYWGDWQTEDAWLWRLSKEHGSAGVLGDVGIHILDFLTAGVGLDVAALHCRLQTFDKAPGNRIGDYTLDANDSCVLNVELENGALGVVHMTRYYTGYRNALELSIHGTQGALRVSTGDNGDQLLACLDEDVNTQQWKLLECEEQADTFERFIDALRSGSAGSPDFAHAYKLQGYLDLCFLSHEQGRWLNVKPHIQ